MITLFPPEAIKKMPSKKKVLNARKFLRLASRNKKALNIFICSLMQCKLAEGLKTAEKVLKLLRENEEETPLKHTKSINLLIF